MKNTINAIVYDIDIENDLNAKSFDNVIKDLATHLESISGDEVQILDRYKDKEVSIWFDSFTFYQDYSVDEILKDNICFLLARDASQIMTEDKTNKKLQGTILNAHLRSKIPTHCIYLSKENVLIMETSQNSASIGNLKNGIKKYSYTKVDFKRRKRKDIIERLNKFVDNIKELEITDLNIHEYLSPKLKEDEDGSLFAILSNKAFHFDGQIKLGEKEREEKHLIFHLFKNAFKTQEYNIPFSNLKIKYINEQEETEIAELFENLVCCKISIEDYKENLSQITPEERVEYSKKIYRLLVKSFYESENN